MINKQVKGKIDETQIKILVKKSTNNLNNNFID